MELSKLSQWRNTEYLEIAQAAFGNDEIINKYIKKAKVASSNKNAEALGDAMQKLSLIGTKTTLSHIAEYMRSPLIIDKVGAYKKSIRLNVIDALRYNFCDRAILNPNKILSMEDYNAVEKFCTNKFGIKYEDSQPPFMTFGAYPIPLIKQ